MREEENKRTSQGSKRLSKKRWVFPAIYIASAAIILTAVFWYQTSSSNDVADDFNYNASDSDITAKNQYNQPAIEVNRSLENFVWPVKNADSAVIQKEFYDMNGTAEQQEAALVSYGNSFQPNTGIDIKMKDDAAFDVVASLSGTVTKVQEDSLLGNVVVIEHDNGVVTQYQSIKDISVKEGDKVAQGQAFAKAGQSMLNEEAGTHVHFEIRKENTPVNPIAYFGKPVSSLQVEKPADEKQSEDGAEDEESAEDPKADKESQNKVDEGETGDGEETPSEEKEQSTTTES